MPIIIPDGLPYTPPGIECLRFAARRGGSGIGCCAVDVFQGFSNDPDDQCPPIPFFDGDSWFPVQHDEGGQLHLTGTNEEVFLSYLVHGSFTNDPVADHGFIAIMTKEQMGSYAGKKWLKILYREGFEYVTAVNNGVYSEYHPVYIFILNRKTDEYLSSSEQEKLNETPVAWRGLQEESRETPEERYKTLLKVYTQTHVAGNPENPDG